MTWFDVTFQHGPKLFHQRSDPREPAVDVTDRAAEFLFAGIKVDEGVTLQDVVKLLDDPVMRTVFRRDYVNELLAEAALGPQFKEEPKHERIEYLELNQLWHLDSSTSEFTSVGKFGLTGKGFVQQEDVIQHGMVMYKKGERINWSVTMASVRELLHLPIRLNNAVQICEEDAYAKRYAHAIQSGINNQITLGTLIHSLLWEFSWHGTPMQRDAFKSELMQSKAEFDAGTAKTTPYENLFEEFGYLPKAKSYPMFFESVDVGSLDAIESAIRDLEDGEAAQVGLNKAFYGALVLKDEFSSLTGRALRVAISEVRRPSDGHLIDDYDPDSDYAAEDRAWDNMAPVGREFGSPDYGRLMEEDAKAFKDNLARLIELCKSNDSARECKATDDELTDILNIQAALSELGQDVSAGLAAAVWTHYSASLAASWMSGADTVRSAQRTLFAYCTAGNFDLPSPS